MAIIMIISSLMGILSGCSKLFAGGASEFVNSRTRQLDRETDRDKKHFVGVLDNIFKALDNKDKQGLKKLFAVNVIKSNPNLDKQIDDLFLFYKGPYENYEGLVVGTAEEWDYGVKKIRLFNGNGLIVTAGGIKYHLDLRIQSKNDEDKDEEGIINLELATEEAYKSKYFCWHLDTPGIYFQSSPERRIGVLRFNSLNRSYVPIDRKLTIDDFSNFIATSNDFYKLIESIGSPDFKYSNTNENYFELENKQIVVCYADYNNKINCIKVMDEENILYTL
jgi:hypothetical protein